RDEGNPCLWNPTPSPPRTLQIVGVIVSNEDAAVTRFIRARGGASDPRFPSGLYVGTDGLLVHVRSGVKHAPVLSQVLTPILTPTPMDWSGNDGMGWTPDQPFS